MPRCPTRSLPPVSRAIDAANRGDTDAFLACFTSDGVVDDWGREFRGASAIAGWSDKEFIGVHVALTVDATETAEADTTVTAQVGGDGFTARRTSRSGSTATACHG